MPEKLTNSECVVCGNFLTLREIRIQDGPQIYGPGNQTMLKITYYCDRCGLRYETLPKGKS